MITLCDKLLTKLTFIAMSKQDLKQYIKKFEEIMPLFHKELIKINLCCVEEMDLTPHQFIVLQTIAKIDNCTMSEISKEFNVTMGNVTMMIDRLIKEGYVTRQETPNDRRVVQVILTKKGKETTAKAAKRKHGLLTEIIGRLSFKETESLLAILNKIVTNKGGEK